MDIGGLGDRGRERVDVGTTAAAAGIATVAAAAAAAETAAAATAAEAAAAAAAEPAVRAPLRAAGTAPKSLPPAMPLLPVPFEALPLPPAKPPPPPPETPPAPAAPSRPPAPNPLPPPFPPVGVARPLPAGAIRSGAATAAGDDLVDVNRGGTVVDLDHEAAAAAAARQSRDCYCVVARAADDDFQHRTGLEEYVPAGRRGKAAAGRSPCCCRPVRRMRRYRRCRQPRSFRSGSRRRRKMSSCAAPESMVYVENDASSGGQRSRTSRDRVIAHRTSFPAGTRCPGPD